MSSLLNWFKPVNKGLDIIDQFVDDGDLAKTLKAELYKAELNTVTIPLIDGLHKLARPALSLAQVGFYYYCIQLGIEITPELVAGVTGPAAIYTMIKGKGK